MLKLVIDNLKRLLHILQHKFKNKQMGCCTSKYDKYLKNTKKEVFHYMSTNKPVVVYRIYIKDNPSTEKYMNTYSLGPDKTFDYNTGMISAFVNKLLSKHKTFWDIVVKSPNKAFTDKIHHWRYNLDAHYFFNGTIEEHPILFTEGEEGEEGSIL